jgi:hypothetical protein
VVSPTLSRTGGRSGFQGATPRRNNFNSVWKAAVKAAGANPDLHLHDLRHAGATLTAQTGATLNEIMSRIGHSSTRAAMIYQHATSKRDHDLAQALDALIRTAREAARPVETAGRALTRRTDLARIWHDKDSAALMQAAQVHSKRCVTWAFQVERVTGIEPA